VAHRRVQDAVDEQRARLLVELILHRLAADRDLDDDVEAFGRIVADGNQIDIQGRGAPVRKRLMPTNNATKLRTTEPATYIAADQYAWRSISSAASRLKAE